MKKYILPVLMAGSLLLTACSEEFLGPDQAKGFSDEKMKKLAIFPESALMLAEGIEAGSYNYMAAFDSEGSGFHDDFGQKAVDLGLDLMSNDMTMSASHWFVNYYNYSARQEPNSRTRVVWGYYTKLASNMNELLRSLEDIEDSSDLIIDVKATRGRAMALRAQANLMLVRIYGDGTTGIPYATESEFLYARQPQSEVNKFIEKDLLTAFEYLDGYQRASKGNIDQSVVAGLLSRYYLYVKDYSKVVTYSDFALNGATPLDFNSINDGFSKISNPDWMWGFDIDGSTTTVYASLFSHLDNTNDGYAGLLGVYKNIDARLYEEIGENDLRQSWFSNGSEDVEENPYELPKYANTKFIDPTFMLGDYLYMRKTEMFLNKAEALAETGQASLGMDIIEELMSTRDASYEFSGSDSEMRDEIRKQRRIELWGEGFSFFDMKRWEMSLARDYQGTNHPTMGRFNYAFPSTKFVFQFPLTEVNANLELGAQNPF